jgi:tRNA G18 (ribose-2'-O)-methylase SpoU
MSVSGSHIERYSSLRDRDLRAEGVFVAEGRILVDRLISASVRLESILCAPRFEQHYQSINPEGTELIVRDDETLERITGFPFHRGVLASGPRPRVRDIASAFAPAAGRRRVVVCSRIVSDENLGAILRSALAFSFDAVIVEAGSGDPFSRRALKASMGSSLLLPVFTNVETEVVVAAASSGDCAVVACEWRAGATTIGDFIFPERFLLVLGGEAKGVSQYWLERADAVVGVPMDSRLDSLNVSVAGGIALYEATRPRDPDRCGDASE